MKPRTVQNHIVGSLTPPRFEISACIKQTEKALGNRFESVRTFCGRFVRLVLDSQPALWSIAHHSWPDISSLAQELRHQSRHADYLAAKEKFEPTWIILDHFPQNIGFPKGELPILNDKNQPIQSNSGKFWMILASPILRSTRRCLWTYWHSLYGPFQPVRRLWNEAADFGIISIRIGGQVRIDLLGLIAMMAMEREVPLCGFRRFRCSSWWKQMSLRMFKMDPMNYRKWI